MSTSRPRFLFLMLSLGLVLILAVALNLGVGVGDLGDESLRGTLLGLRSMRVSAAFLAGAALSVGGAAVQGLFRNPLASPSILGTTAGAALGGECALLVAEVAGVSWLPPEMLLPVGCLLGAMLSLLVLLALLKRTDDRLMLLLTGFLLNSLFLALGSLIVSMAQERWELGRAVVSFALGSLSGVGGQQVAFALPLVLVGAVAAWGFGRSLDVLLSGEREAHSLGVEVSEVRWWTVVWTSVLVAAAVSLAGSLAFVGLIVPHAMRPFAGVSHRRLMPAVALAGGTFVVSCDVIARTASVRSEIPLGVVTALIGAPLFLWLLSRDTRGVRDA